MEFDIAILGGGPAGYNAAEKASSGGLRTVLFEKKELGGVCLNEGCIPTKTLLHSAKLYDHAKEAQKYGVIVDEVSYDYKRIIARKNKVVKKLTAGVAYKMASNGIEVIKEIAKLAGEDNEYIRLETESGSTYKARYVLLCTGSEAFVPPIPGLEKVDYWTSREALSSKEQPKSIIIVGGGVIGSEFAAFFNSMGTAVSVVEMLPEILGSMDKEAAAMLRKEYESRGVKYYLNTKVTAVTEKGVRIETSEGMQDLEAERILMSVGRRANVLGLGLDSINVETSKFGVIVNEYMQTSHPRIYAAGDITGHSLLAHTAIREGEIAIGHILGDDIPMSYNAIPSVVYTNPEIAGVGKTEEELKAEQKYYRVLKLPMAYSGRFIVENESGDGFLKLLVDENECILGCHMIGNPSSEIIYGMAIAIDNGETIHSLSQHVYPHPTVAEIIHEALHL